MLNNPKAKRLRLWLKQDKCCIWCNKEIALEEATLEHLRAKACNGDDSDLNLAVACFDCNSARGARLNKALQLERLQPEPRQKPKRVKYINGFGAPKKHAHGRKRVVDRSSRNRYDRKSKEQIDGEEIDAD